MSKIIDSLGKGAPLNQTEHDDNFDSFHGINQVIAGATHTVDITDQGDTLEFTNAGAVAVTLDSIATIQGAADTSDFHITLLATNAATVATITPNVANSFNTGVATIVLTVDEYVTLETDATGLVWNIKNNSNASKVGGLSASQFLRSDANDTATGNLTFSGANTHSGGDTFSGNVGLDGTWDINGAQVTKTAAQINDLVDKSTAQTITGKKIIDNDLEFDCDTLNRKILFQSLSNLSWLVGQVAGSVLLYDDTNTRNVFRYDPTTDTFTVRNLVSTGAALTTPVVSGGTFTTPIINTPILNLPAFRGESNAIQVMSGTQTKILFAVEVFDKTSDYATSRFTPSEAGVYLVHACVSLSCTPPGTFNLWIYKNGAISRLKKRNFAVTGESIEVSVLLEMNGTTDYVEIFGQLAGISAASIEATGRSNYFEAHRVSS